MPSNLVKTPADEKAWDRAKAAAAKSKGKSVSDLKDDDYALVNHIFQKMKENMGQPGFDEFGTVVNEAEARMTLLRRDRAPLPESDGFEPVGDGKRKKCACGQYDKDGRCACGSDNWVFAPLFGDGDGHSMATMPHDNVRKDGPSESPPSGALPGTGGINSPDVPPGPNAGTGPLATSMTATSKTYRSPDGKTVAQGPLRVQGTKYYLDAKGPAPDKLVVPGYAIVKVQRSAQPGWSRLTLRAESAEKPMSLKSLNESLSFAVKAAAPSLPIAGDDPDLAVTKPAVEDEGLPAGDASMQAAKPVPEAGPVPVAVSPVAPTGTPTVMSVLIAAVHRQYTHAGDLLFAHGYMDQDKRIALSSCVGDALKQLTLSIQSKCPWAATAEVGADVAQSAVTESRLRKERT